MLELGETVADGLQREVHEETGLRVRPGSLAGIYKNTRIGVVVLVFRCVVEGGELRSSDESAGFKGWPHRICALRWTRHTEHESQTR